MGFSLGSVVSGQGSHHIMVPPRSFSRILQNLRHLIMHWGAGGIKWVTVKGFYGKTFLDIKTKRSFTQVVEENMDDIFIVLAMEKLWDPFFFF